MQHLTPNSTLQNGKYRIERVLGQGGFGITYLATQTGTDKRVCIKEFFLKDFCNRDKDSSYVTCTNDTTQELADTYRKKFCKEAQMLKGLRHPNLVEIYDTFEENNTAYYVMEYIEGASLAEIIKEKGCLPENEAVGYIVKVATALEYVHSKKINHLDIKPANILIRKSDKQVFLIDFGTSKHYDAKTGTATTLTSATYSPGFAPIEQYRQGGVNEFTPESDVYSLGATLYKLLTGITPPEPSERLNSPTLEMPSTISYSTRTTVKKAMNVVKAKRYRSISEMKDRLQGVRISDREQTEIYSRGVDEETRMLGVSTTASSVIKSPKTGSLNKQISTTTAPNKKESLENTGWGESLSNLLITLVCTFFVGCFGCMVGIFIEMVALAAFHLDLGVPMTYYGIVAAALFLVAKALH